MPYYRGVPCLYTAKPTLAELLEDTPTLLDSITVPAGLQTATLKALIVRECGELQTLYKDAATMAAHLPVWSSIMLPGWTKAYEAITAEYNPIHNYDRNETEAEIENNVSAAAGNSTTSGQETRDVGRQGYNSAGYAGSDQDRSGYSGSAGTDSTATSNATRTLGRSISGNIGVTTSQQMVEAELELRGKWTIYGIMLEAFRRDLCVEVY